MAQASSSWPAVSRVRPLSVDWGQLDGTVVLPYKGVSESVLTLLSGSSIQLLFGAAILCTFPARHLPRLPPDLAIIVACEMTVESILTCKTSSREDLWSAMVIWYSLY